MKENTTGDFLHPRCSICDELSDVAYGAGDYRMFRCRGCRTAFVSPQPDEAFLERFYSDFHRTLSEGGIYECIEERMHADFPAKVNLVRNAMNHVPNHGGRVLDVGCGKGYFVRSLADAGWNAVGVDLSDTAVQFARETLKVDALCGESKTLPNRSESSTW